MRVFKELFRISNPLYSEKDDKRVSTQLKTVKTLVCVQLTTGGWEVDRRGKPDPLNVGDGKSWLLAIRFGRGAGYILGRTLFLGHRIRDRFRDCHNQYHKTWMVGFTQNANKVPYVDGN